MAITASIDTLAYAKKLMSAGVPQGQAEAQAEALFETVEANLVTKQDLANKLHAIDENFKEVKQSIVEMDHRITYLNNSLRQEIQRESSSLRSEMQQESKGLRQEMQQLRQELRQEMTLKNAELKNDLIKWVIGISTTQTAVVFSLFISMFKLLH